MIKKLVCVCLLLSVSLLSGCLDAVHEKADTISASDTPASELHTFAPETTSDQTETTEPDLSLPIESGAHLMRYEDENTSDYLDYYLFVPNNPQINMPLIVFLHGDGEVGKVECLENYSMMVSAREIYGEEFPFIAIFPCTRVYSWTDGTVPQTLMGLINKTVENCCIDPRRIIITGHSRGAMGTWAMISSYSDYFAAAVPVSCGAEVLLDYDSCAKVPVLAFVGNSGNMELSFQYAMGQIVQNLTHAGGQAELIILDGCTHDDTSEQAYTEETFRWMLEQKRGKK